MYQRILVPLDTSAFAEEAVERAARLAQAWRAELHLVIVHQLAVVTAEGAVTLDTAWEQEVERYHHDHMLPLADRLRQAFAVPVSAVRLDGQVVGSLVEYVASQGIGLIVMTSHGRTGIGRAWLGSVADGLMRQATVPVLIFRHHDQANARSDAGPVFQRILVPLDGSGEAEQVLDDVAALAGVTGAEVIVVRVVEPGMPPMPTGIPEVMTGMLTDVGPVDRSVDEAEEYLSTVVQALHRRGVAQVEPCVQVAARVGPALADVIGGYLPDLVAMTTHGRGMSRLLLGSVADAVLRGTDGAVLLRRRMAIDAGAAATLDIAAAGT
jgi:nucleotide-binding universal stress UspA family protein